MRGPGRCLPIAARSGARQALPPTAPPAQDGGHGQAEAGTHFSVQLATLLTAEQFKCTILAHSISLEVQRTIHSETELQRHRIPLKEKFTNVAAPSLLPCLPSPPLPRRRQTFSPNVSVEGIPDQISPTSPCEARSPRSELRFLRARLRRPRTGSAPPSRVTHWQRWLKAKLSLSGLQAEKPGASKPLLTSPWEG